MTAEQRKQKILELLKEKDSVRVTSLSQTELDANEFVGNISIE